MSSHQIETHINNIEDFQNILNNNQNLIIIKLTAEYCGPCKTIKPMVDNFFNYMIQLNRNIKCYNIDIELNPVFAGFLKKKKILSGVPAFLCYKKGNTSPYPDEYLLGANHIQLNNFFNTCISHSL